MLQLESVPLEEQCEPAPIVASNTPQTVGKSQAENMRFVFNCAHYLNFKKCYLFGSWGMSCLYNQAYYGYKQSSNPTFNNG